MHTLYRTGTRLDAICCLRKFWEKEELRKTEGYNFAEELLQRQSYPLLLCTDVEEIVSLMTDILIKKDTHYQEDKYRYVCSFCYNITYIEKKFT